MPVCTYVVFNLPSISFWIDNISLIYLLSLILEFSHEMSAFFPSMQLLHIVPVLSQAALLLCLVTLQGNCWTEDLVSHNVPDAFSFIPDIMWDSDLCHTQISRTTCSSPLEQTAWPAVELFLDHASSYSVSFGIVLHLKTLDYAKKHQYSQNLA